MRIVRVMALWGVLFCCGVSRAGVVDLDFLAVQLNGETVFGDLFDDPLFTPDEIVYPFGDPGPEENGLLTLDNFEAVAALVISSPEEEVGFITRAFPGDLPLDRFILISFLDQIGNAVGVLIGNNFAVAFDPDNDILGDIVFIGTTEFEVDMSIIAETGQFDLVVNETPIFSGITAFQGNPVTAAQIAVLPEPAILAALLLTIPILRRRY